MTLSAARVSSRTKFLLGAMAAAALALAPQAMLAQHGGGGGHFGGGGGHFGGAASGSHSSPAPASHSSSKPSAPVRPPWAPTNVHNSVSAASRPALSSPFAESPAPEGIARGDAAISAEPSPALPHTTTIGFPRSAAPGAEQWQVVTPSRGGVLSFSGQGHDIWQNSPGVTSPGTAARGAVAGSRPAVNELSTHPRMFPPTRFYPNPILYGPGYGFFGPGFGFDPFFFDFGFGPGCDPYWSNFGCSGFGYMGGYSGYGYYPYVYDPGAYAAANGGADDSGQYSTSDNLAASNDTSATATVLYLKSGGSFEVTDYWLADGQVEYDTSYGGENSVGLDELDIARTVTENSAHGVSFVLREGRGSAPAAPAPAPDSSPAPRR